MQSLNKSQNLKQPKKKKPGQEQLHSLTNNSFNIRAFQSCQSQISYLHQACGAVDEDVVTFEISMDDGLAAGV